LYFRNLAVHHFESPFEDRTEFPESDRTEFPEPASFIGASPDVVRSIEGGWLERKYALSKAEIQQHHARMQTATEGAAITPAHGAALQGRSMAFKEDKEISELRLFVFDHKWFLKYRLTYPESCQVDARQRIEELTSRLPWATV
jgi:hypothetical protein